MMEVYNSSSSPLLTFPSGTIRMFTSLSVHFKCRLFMKLPGLLNQFVLYWNSNNLLLQLALQSLFLLYSQLLITNIWMWSGRTYVYVLYCLFITLTPHTQHKIFLIFAFKLHAGLNYIEILFNSLTNKHANRKLSNTGSYFVLIRFITIQLIQQFSLISACQIIERLCKIFRFLNKFTLKISPVFSLLSWKSRILQVFTSPFWACFLYFFKKKKKKLRYFLHFKEIVHFA